MTNFKNAEYTIDSDELEDYECDFLNFDKIIFDKAQEIGILPEGKIEIDILSREDFYKFFERIFYIHYPETSENYILSIFFRVWTAGDEVGIDDDNIIYYARCDMTHSEVENIDSRKFVKSLLSEFDNIRYNK